MTQTRPSPKNNGGAIVRVTDLVSGDEFKIPTDKAVLNIPAEVGACTCSKILTYRLEEGTSSVRSECYLSRESTRHSSNGRGLSGRVLVFAVSCMLLFWVVVVTVVAVVVPVGLFQFVRARKSNFGLEKRRPLVSV